MIPVRNCGGSFAQIQGAEFRLVLPLGGWRPQGHQLQDAAAGARGKLAMKCWKRTLGSPVLWTEIVSSCIFFLQRVLVQATGSAPKGAQMQQISVPRVQQVPQQVRDTGHSHTTFETVPDLEKL